MLPRRSEVSANRWFRTRLQNANPRSLPGKLSPAPSQATTAQPLESEVEESHTVGPVPPPPRVLVGVRPLNMVEPTPEPAAKLKTWCTSKSGVVVAVTFNDGDLKKKAPGRRKVRSPAATELHLHAAAGRQRAAKTTLRRLGRIAQREAELKILQHVERDHVGGRGGSGFVAVEDDHERRNYAQRGRGGTRVDISDDAVLIGVGQRDGEV